MPLLKRTPRHESFVCSRNPAGSSCRKRAVKPPMAILPDDRTEREYWSISATRIPPFRLIINCFRLSNFKPEFRHTKNYVALGHKPPVAPRCR